MDARLSPCLPPASHLPAASELQCESKFVVNPAQAPGSSRHLDDGNGVFFLARPLGLILSISLSWIFHGNLYSWGRFLGSLCLEMGSRRWKGRGEGETMKSQVWRLTYSLVILASIF